MPQVGNKHFPYTPKGKAAAKKARTRSPLGVVRPGFGGASAMGLKRGVFKNRYADSSRKELRSQLERQEGRVTPGGKTLAEQKAAVLGKLIARKEAQERKSKPPTPGHQVKDMVPKPDQVTNTPRPFPVKGGLPGAVQPPQGVSVANKAQAANAIRPMPNKGVGRPISVDRGAPGMKPNAAKRKKLRQFVNRLGR